MLQPGYEIGPLTIGLMAGIPASRIAAFSFGSPNGPLSGIDKPAMRIGAMAISLVQNVS